MGIFSRNRGKVAKRFPRKMGSNELVDLETF
jgi:hypothetical protein